MRCGSSSSEVLAAHALAAAERPARETVKGRYFAAIAESTVDRMVALAREWRADLLLAEARVCEAAPPAVVNQVWPVAGEHGAVTVRHPPYNGPAVRTDSTAVLADPPDGLVSVTFGTVLPRLSSAADRPATVLAGVAGTGAAGGAGDGRRSGAAPGPARRPGMRDAAPLTEVLALPEDLAASPCDRKLAPTKEGGNR